MITYTEGRLSSEVHIDFLKRMDLGLQYPKERFRKRIRKLDSTDSLEDNAKRVVEMWA